MIILTDPNADLNISVSSCTNLAKLALKAYVEDSKNILSTVSSGGTEPGISAIPASFEGIED